MQYGLPHMCRIALPLIHNSCKYKERKEDMLFPFFFWFVFPVRQNINTKEVYIMKIKENELEKNLIRRGILSSSFTFHL